MVTHVTQEGMVASQPGTSVSVSSPAYDSKLGFVAGARLNVTRHYNDLPNEFGGKGRSKALDFDGKLFATTEEAWKFVREHGYNRVYHGSYERREQRRANGEKHREIAFKTRELLQAKRFWQP